MRRTHQFASRPGSQRIDPKTHIYVGYTDMRFWLDARCPDIGGLALEVQTRRISAGSTSASLARLASPVLSGVIGDDGRCLCAPHWRRRYVPAGRCTVSVRERLSCAISGVTTSAAVDCIARLVAKRSQRSAPSAVFGLRVQE